MWSTSLSGGKSQIAPIPLSFSINPTQALTSNSRYIYTDRYTAQFKLDPPLIIPDGCCVELNQASFCYSQPNIASQGEIDSIPTGNNRLTIYLGLTPYNIYVPTSLCDYLDVMYWINVDARNKLPPGTLSATNLFTLVGIPSTQQLVISLNPLAFTTTIFPAMVISFQNPNPTTGINDSIGNVLGFQIGSTSDTIIPPVGSSTIYSVTGNKAAAFSDTSAYALYMSLVSSSYKDGLTGSLLNTFPLGGYKPNNVASFQASLRYPVQISAGCFSNISIWTTDQSGNRLPWKYYQSPFEFSCLISKNKPDGSI